MVNNKKKVMKKKPGKSRIKKTETTDSQNFFYATKKVEGYNQKDGWVKSHERTIKVSLAWVTAIAGAWWFGNILWKKQMQLNKDFTKFTTVTRKTLKKQSEVIGKQGSILEKNQNILFKILQNPGFQAYAEKVHGVKQIVPAQRKR